jgi:tetratricopeptide (TPR) repeat protein
MKKLLLFIVSFMLMACFALAQDMGICEGKWSIPKCDSLEGPGCDEYYQTIDDRICVGSEWYVPCEPNGPCLESEDKQSALVILKSLTATDKKSIRELEKAIKYIEKSLGNLDPEGGDKKIIWYDDTHIACKHGQKMFDNEKKAVHHLEKLLKNLKKKGDQTSITDDVNHVIDILVNVDKIVAETTVNEAEGKGVPAKDIAKAQANLEKGNNADTSKTKTHKIQYYKKSWKYINKYCDKPDKDGSKSCIEEITLLSPNGDYVTAEGDDVGHPETTFTDFEDTSVTVHTSCSRCLYVGQIIEGWNITYVKEYDGSTKLAEKCSQMTGKAIALPDESSTTAAIVLAILIAAFAIKLRI